MLQRVNSGSAGEQMFHEEIRSVVEAEVTKLIQPLEEQLKKEVERRKQAERLLLKAAELDANKV